MPVDDPTLTSSSPLTPAKPSLRIKAKILDFLLFFMLFVIFITLGSRLLPDIVIDIVGGSLIGLLLLYLTLSEGLLGTSLGKKNYRLRVIRSNQDAPPGIFRAFLRNSVILLLYLFYRLSKGLLMIFFDPGQEIKPDYRSLIIIFLFVLCGFVLFLTARRKNGFAGLHDLISGTRVVFKPKKSL